MRITRRRVLLYLAVLILAPLLTAAVLLPTYPLKAEDREEAGRLIVAWAVEGKPLPGSNEAFGEPASFRDNPRILVVCDWLPEHWSLSDARAVQRVTAREARGLVERDELFGTSVLVLDLKPPSAFHLLVEVTPGGRTAPRHVYEVTVRRRLWGLEARVKVKDNR